MSESVYTTSNTSTDKGRKISIKTKINKNERQEETADPRGYVWDLGLTPKRDSYHYPAQAILDESVDTLMSQEMPRPTSRSIRVLRIYSRTAFLQGFVRCCCAALAIQLGPSDVDAKEGFARWTKGGECGVITICAIAVCG